MRQIKIVDKSFSHDVSTCPGRHPKEFRWQWLDPQDGYHFPNESIFFTDKMLDQAPFYSARLKVALILEPDGIARRHYDYIASHLNDFDFVLTYDRKLQQIDQKKILPYTMGICWIAEKDRKIYEKTKFCSIIASAKAVSEGHKLRHSVIDYFGGIDSPIIDVFGGGYRPIDNKIEALRDYRFTIVIENCKQDSYYSEKLVDAFATGTVPIYWGTKTIGQFFDEGGIVKFKSPEHLETLFESLRSPKCFDSFRESITQNFSRVDANTILEDQFWDRYPFLFSETTHQSTSRKPHLISSVRKRDIEIDSLRDRITKLSFERDKAKAERNRYRSERNSARQQRNLARAERDEAKKKAGLGLTPDDDSFFYENRREFYKQMHSDGVSTAFAVGKDFPIIGERDIGMETTKGHHFYQDLHVARLILNSEPCHHIDVGSRVDGFVAHIAAVREITVLDNRNVPSNYDRIAYIQGDLMDLDPVHYDSCDSLSCLHVIEHLGLGRYGDTIDPNGHLKGLQSLTKMLKPGGKLYFSTPIGNPRIHFNAHRVFSLRYLYDLLEQFYEIASFAFVDDQGELNLVEKLSDEDKDSNCGCRYGCGIFELTKKSDVPKDPIFQLPLSTVQQSPTEVAQAQQSDVDKVRDPEKKKKSNPNLENRNAWIEKQLKSLPAGLKILDAGAGQCPYRKYCGHLDYVSQDFGNYDGSGDGGGLQTHDFDLSGINIRSDITDIPQPDESFDAILCTEVLEHVPDALAACRELCRLLKPGGVIIITAPFCSLTHYSPYHFATGFNRYFYEEVARRHDLETIELTENGNFFSFLIQEFQRVEMISNHYIRDKFVVDDFESLRFPDDLKNQVIERLKKLEKLDAGSEELLSFGFHFKAKKLK